MTFGSWSRFSSAPTLTPMWVLLNTEVLEKQLKIIMNKTHKKIIKNLPKRNELRLKKLYTGIQLLCISLITIISGPILIQIGFIKSKGIVNLYSILGVLVCVLAIILIFAGIKKIGDYIFNKNDR